MQAPRVDLYGAVHKALRSRLFDLAVELDRCAFGRPAEVAITLAAYRRTVGFLREHHHHEDQFIDVAIRELAPDILQTVTSHHAASDTVLGELDGLATAVEGADPEAGSRLAARYRQFLVMYLAHMNYEETTVNAALWSKYSDPELAAIRGRLQASIPPARFGEWLEIMLPAINLDERAGMLGGMKANAPPPAFAMALEIASRVLGSAGIEAVRSRIGG
jgi:hypothetical protein